MKVCHVTMNYSPRSGGQELYISALIDIFNRHGINSTVIQPFRIDGEKSDGILYLKNFPKFHLVQWVIQGAKWFSFNLSLFFAKKTLKEFDILICNYPFHYPVLRWHKKVIVLSHGVLWRSKMNTFFDRVHQRIGISLPKSETYIVANDTHFLREIGYKIEPSTRYFTKVFPNVWFIPNCVDTSKFRPKENTKRQNRIIVPRNIRHERGIHLAIESFARFYSLYPSYELVIAGGPTHGEYYEYCLNLANDLGIVDKVVCTGFLNGESLLAEYQKSMICLIPSIELEGTSLSALEAMSCGTPTICTDVAGLKDLPSVHSAANPEEMSVKIVDVLNNWEFYSETQMKKVAETFNLQNWESAWLKVVEEVYITNR